MTVRIYAGLGGLRHFNPDLDVEPWPEPVIDLRAQIGWADGLIVSSPEYARGIPGAFKNALDWLVSSDVFPGKPVALFNASSRSVAMQAALRLTFETMSARVIDDACITIPLLGGARTGAEIAGDPEMAAMIDDALKAFAAMAHVPVS
jgi:NAD(P)H-dependent FMN reductase